MFEQIKLKETEQGETPIKVKDQDVVKLETIEEPPPLKPNTKELPLPDQDEHIIAITLKRLTEKDKYVTEFNEIISGLLH